MKLNLPRRTKKRIPYRERAGDPGRPFEPSPAVAERSSSASDMSIASEVVEHRSDDGGLRLDHAVGDALDPPQAGRIFSHHDQSGAGTHGEGLRVGGFGGRRGI